MKVTKNPTPRINLNQLSIIMCTITKLKSYEILVKSMVKSTENPKILKSIHSLVELVICCCLEKVADTALQHRYYTTTCTHI